MIWMPDIPDTSREHTIRPARREIRSAHTTILTSVILQCGHPACRDMDTRSYYNADIPHAVIRIPSYTYARRPGRQDKL